MKKKDLKVVDVDDLQPEHSILDDEEEIIVEPKINLDDLNRSPPSVKVNPKSPSKKVESKLIVKKVDPSILKSPRFKNYKGSGSKQSVVDFMSNKLRFDDKRYDRFRVGCLVALAVAGFAHRYIGDDIETFRASFISAALPMFDLILNIYELYVKSYILFILLYLWIFPLKQHTQAMVEIYYDGLTVPSEVFPMGRAKRKRVKWAEIIDIDYKNKYSTPFVQLLNKKKEVVGEFRLNLDNMEGLFEALDTYCPTKNPLRNLFTNTHNS